MRTSQGLKALLVAGLVWSMLMVSNASMAFANEMNSPGVIHSQDLESFMDTVLLEKMEELHIPGATVSVVAGGEVIFEKGYGYARLDDQVRVEADKTMFRIGSASKLFTWTAVMQLVEHGKLDLNVDINEYLDFQIPSKLVRSSSDQTEVKPITLAHLMTHTPGFEDYADAIFRLSEENTLPLYEYVRTYMPARVFPAGQVLSYSNYGTALAGYIVEQVSGMPFADYIEQNIYTPLGIQNSTFRQPLPESLSPHLAQAYRYVDGDFRAAEFEFVPEPAGGMSSTASDMAKFMIAFLQKEQSPILGKDTIDNMFSQHFTQHPDLDGMGLGFIERTSNGRRALFHAGSTMLFDTGMFLLPEERVGLFISYSGGNYLLHSEMFQAFMDRYFPSEQSETLQPPNGTVERSKKFVGEYHQNRKSFTTSESLVSLTMGVIRVEMDDAGYLLVHHAGETNRFVETEPGIYRALREGRSPDAYGEFRTIVFGTGPDGGIMLAADGPMTYSKAPGYATSSFTFLSLIVAILLFVGTLVSWGIAVFIRTISKRRKSGLSKSAAAARWAVIAYGVLTLGAVLGVVSSGQINPVYGLPNAALGIVTPWGPIVDRLPLLMCLVGALMVILAVLVWRNKAWKMPGRIHYSLLTVAAMGMLWIFGYWNII